MNDGVEPPQPFRRAENDVRHFATVDGLIGQEDFGSEAMDDILPGGLSRLLRFMGQLVKINQTAAQAHKHFRNG
ncbi:MAG: hypothetical protein BWX45_01101 [Deltaproteobacteria bacterium ADurb.Bin002]|nr:MAG: hypothetical protein BWX45_01101 [Deltaproteobacteria bacterium ADurb.Bin002]